MHFVSRRDLDAPIEYVFESLCDFDGVERWALRRGANLRRLDPPGSDMPQWQVRFALHQKPREFTVSRALNEPPRRMRFDGESRHMWGDLQLDFAELSARRTRLTLRFEMRPMTLTARIMVQTLRLARSRMERKLNRGIARIAAGIEARHRAGEAPAIAGQDPTTGAARSR